MSKAALMPSFEHASAALRLFHGPDSLARLGRELERLGARRAVIFCGQSMGRQGQLLELVRQAAGEHCVGVFDGVQAHSPLVSVQAGAAYLGQTGADAVIALGGGSAIVTARAASIVLAEGRPVHELCTRRDERGALNSPKLLQPKLAQLVLPSTPTTAMVKAGSAVFDPTAGERLPLFDPKTRAAALFIHPELIATAPRHLILSASLNTLTMAVEGLVSRVSNPLADAQLMHALRLIAGHLQRPDSMDDPAVRGELLLAAVLCGQGSDHTGAGITTVLGHALGARFGTENGLVNAVVLPHALRFNGQAAQAGMGKVAAALGLTSTGSASEVTERLSGLLAGLSIPSRLQELQVPAEPLEMVARLAMADWFLRGNPRPVTEAGQLLAVLQAAW